MVHGLSCRRSVALFTARGERSSFLHELVEEGAAVVNDSDGEAVGEVRCPLCKEGVIVTRSGSYGEFQSCSSFPYCEYKPRKRSNEGRGLG
jgi:DNA helicase-4